MIREAISRIFEEYATARTEEFTSHPLAVWIRREVPQVFATAAASYPYIKWEASAGQGRWADAPWIAGFDPLITESAQVGYYPVYLFTRSLDAVYLSLNQGMSHLREELGSEAKATLTHRASVLRARSMPDYRRSFPNEAIDLQPPASSSRLAFYEPGHAYGIKYSLGAIPDEQRLVSDLTEMLRLYAAALAKGGTLEIDNTGHGITEQEDDNPLTLTLEEKRRLTYHRRVERNSRLSMLAKKIHGYTCQVCGFNFKLSYGELGENYIEAHHLTPLASLPPNQSVMLSPKDDFAVVCANCHRMLHRNGAPDSFQAFRRSFRRTR